MEKNVEKLVTKKQYQLFLTYLANCYYKQEDVVASKLAEKLRPAFATPNKNTLDTFAHFWIEYAKNKKRDWIKVSTDPNANDYMRVTEKFTHDCYKTCALVCVNTDFKSELLKIISKANNRPATEEDLEAWMKRARSMDDQEYDGKFYR